MLEELGTSIGEQISQTVFGDILQMLFEEKLLTKREAELLSVTTTDEVLGSEAHRLRANILRKNYPTSTIERECNLLMNYSKALLETIEAAQILAGHFESQTLDTWHILVA